MASAQMALPVDRRNGASAHRPAPAARPPADPTPVPAGAVEAKRPSAPTAVSEAPVWVRRVTTAAVLAVALVAALASYEHMRALAAMAGEGCRAWLLPVSVDGLAVAASMTMLVRRRAGEPTGALAWVALLLGLGATGGERGGGPADSAGPAGGGVAAGGPAVVLRAAVAADQSPGWSWRPNRPPRCFQPSDGGDR